MTEDTGKTFSQADLLEEQIKEREQTNPDSPMLAFMRTQLASMRRQERQKAGLERSRENPCM